MLEAIRSRLVEDAHDWHKWWSVRWAAVGAVLLPTLEMLPSMPQEIQSLIPPAYRAAAAFFWMAGAIAFRLLAQRKSNG
jgi:hypothetical protein